LKRSVNGVEVELEHGREQVSTLSDRLVVHSDSGAETALAVRVGDAVHVSYRGIQYLVEPVRARRSADGRDHSGDLVSPMPGLVVEVMCEDGESVVKGQKILVLEAMKTQQTFAAPFDGVVANLVVGKGEQVVEGLVMAVVRPTEAAET